MNKNVINELNQAKIELSFDLGDDIGDPVYTIKKNGCFAGNTNEGKTPPYKGMTEHLFELAKTEASIRRVRYIFYMVYNFELTISNLKEFSIFETSVMNTLEDYHVANHEFITTMMHLKLSDKQ